jgi:hypothetical protein
MCVERRAARDSEMALAAACGDEREESRARVVRRTKVTRVADDVVKLDSALQRHTDGAICSG